MADAYVTQHALDVIFKLEAESLSAALSGYLGLTLPPIVRHYSGELLRLDVRMERLDTVFELADSRLLHLEYQSTYDREDLLRFLRYDVGLYQKERRQIETVVIYGPNVTAAPSELSLGSVHYRVTNVHLGTRDGEETYRRLQAHVAQRQPLGEREQLDLVFLPLMANQRPTEEVIRSALDLAQHLPQERERLRTIGALLALAYHYLRGEAFDRLMEDVMAKNLLENVLARSLQEGFDRGFAQGREQGLAQGLEQGLEQGLVQARREGILKALASRRLDPTPALVERLAEVEDPALLDVLFDVALRATTLAEVERVMDGTAGGTQ